MAVTNKSYIHEQFKSRLNLENAPYRSVHNIRSVGGRLKPLLDQRVVQHASGKRDKPNAEYVTNFSKHIRFNFMIPVWQGGRNRVIFQYFAVECMRFIAGCFFHIGSDHLL